MKARTESDGDVYPSAEFPPRFVPGLECRECGRNDQNTHLVATSSGSDYGEAATEWRCFATGVWRERIRNGITSIVVQVQCADCQLSWWSGRSLAVKVVFDWIPDLPVSNLEDQYRRWAAEDKHEELELIASEFEDCMSPRITSRTDCRRLVGRRWRHSIHDGRCSLCGTHFRLARDSGWPCRRETPT
jgi:hypothetical protein